MRATTTNRGPASGSLADRLRELLRAIISDEVEGKIRRVDELILSDRRRKEDMAEALAALEESAKPLRNWLKVKKAIGDAMGREARTVQRGLTRRHAKVRDGEAPHCAQSERGPDQGTLVGVEHTATSVTDECLREATERAGRRLTFKIKAESDAAYTARTSREAKARFPSGSDRARRAAVGHMRAQLKALNLSVAELEDVKWTG